MRDLASLQFEKRDIVLLCRRPQPIAEVAARVKIPLGVARVLVSDLTAAGALAGPLAEHRTPRPAPSSRGC